MKVIKVDLTDIENIKKKVNERRLLFNECICPSGCIDYELLNKTCIHKKKWIILDRNILSSLLMLCENGELQDKKQQEDIGLIMSWSFLNNGIMTSGLGAMEYSTKMNNQPKGIDDIEYFKKILAEYSFHEWCDIGLNKSAILRKIRRNCGDTDVSVTLNDGCDFYYMATAALLRITLIRRNKDLSSYEKIKTYIDWAFNNTRFSLYTFIYAVLIFTDYKGIKFPKNNNSSDARKVLEGCKNQAWDLTYLNTVNEYSKRFSDRVFFLATEDGLLKTIFEYAAIGDYEVFLKKSIKGRQKANGLIEHIKIKINDKSRKISMISDDKIYYKRLIDEEMQELGESE